MASSSLRCRSSRCGNNTSNRTASRPCFPSDNAIPGHRGTPQKATPCFRTAPDLLRNSFRYAARQDWDKIAKLLKPACTAATEDTALDRFAEFADARGKKYPAIVRLWKNAWEEFTPFLRFDTEIRRTVCTTNAIESVNARIGRTVKARRQTE